MRIVSKTVESAITYFAGKHDLVSLLIKPFWLEPAFRAVQLGCEDRVAVEEASGPGGCSAGTGSPSSPALSASPPSLPPPALPSQPLLSQAPTRGTPFLPISPKKRKICHFKLNV